MKLYSTNDQHRSQLFSLEDAVSQGLAPDGGLFMPMEIPKLAADFWQRLPKMSFQEIAFEVANTLLMDDVPEEILKEIVEEAVNFEAPLVELKGGDQNIQVMELFHGPTLAFKDFGGRFMSRLMRYVMRDHDEEITILVATSGDTGSAVASGFYQVPGFRVVLLYPKGKVSKIQEMQFTTLGENVSALEIDGTFDDCQRMVKEAFVDEELRTKLTLTSANSINIARLIPQSFYYFNAYKQLLNLGLAEDGIVFSVPSGNFGNLTAALFAKKMGLPIKTMVAATNVNAIIPEYLKSGEYQPKPSIHTISNAMDIGNPSNFARMQEFYPSLATMKTMIAGYSFDDQETRVGIKEVFEKFNYIMCPHTAIGYLGLKQYLAETGLNDGVVLSTAHPAKFYETVEAVTGERVEIPERLAECLEKEKHAEMMQPQFEALKNYLI